MTVLRTVMVADLVDVLTVLVVTVLVVEVPASGEVGGMTLNISGTSDVVPTASVAAVVVVG